MKKLVNRAYGKPILFAVLLMAAFLLMNNICLIIADRFSDALLGICVCTVLEVGMAIAATLWLKGKIGRGFTPGISGKNLGKVFLLAGTFYISMLMNLQGLFFALSRLDPNAAGRQILTDVLYAVVGGLRPGIVEELVCRVCIMGYLVYMWEEKPHGLRRAVWVSALIFGLAHMNNVFSQGLALTLIQCLYATAIGGLLGAVYARTRNVLGLMVIHAIVDIISIISSVLPVLEDAAQAAQESLDAVSVAAYLLVTLIWGGTALFLLRERKLAEAKVLWQPEPTAAAA